jgi:superoxide dismutase, Fe-Mn family
MAIIQPPLPYAVDALAPHISAETLELHHGKHHKAYVDKMNATIAGTVLAEAPLETIIRSAAGDANQTLFNNAAQAWNHSFYWHSLTPDRTEPSVALMAAISKNYGSLDGLTGELGETAKAHFGSGWAWLVARGGDLMITDTHDAGTAVTQEVRPLLVIDVWEHAYYVDRRNDRPAHIAAVTGNLLNWDFASENFARDCQWVHG